MIGALIGAYAGYKLAPKRSRAVGAVAGAAVGWGGDYLVYQAISSVSDKMDDDEKKGKKS